MSGDTLRSIGTHSFTLIGDPRSLAPASNGSTICIGLRDGSVAVIDADWPDSELPPTPSIIQGLSAERASAPIVDARTGVGWQEAVRAMCHVMGPWWLVARSNRCFHWLRVSKQARTESGSLSAKPAWAGDWKIAEPQTGDFNTDGLRATHISVLDAPNQDDGEDAPLRAVDLIVSYARTDKKPNEHCTLILRATPGVDRTEPPRLEFIIGFKKFGRLRSAIRIAPFEGEQGRWLLVGYTGSVDMLVRVEDDYEPLPDFEVEWTGGAADSTDWSPALVNDVTAVRGPKRALRNEVVLSTDIGAFVMHIQRNGATTQRLDHAGLRGVPLAVACTTPSSETSEVLSGARRRTKRADKLGSALASEVAPQPAYVWCYDSLSGVHVYEGRLGADRAAWNRIQSQGRDTPAVLAVAFQTPSERLVVWQNCRDESIAVTRYQPPGSKSKASSDSGGAETWIDFNDAESPNDIREPENLRRARDWLANTYGPPADVPRDGAEHAPPSPRESPAWVLAELFDPAPEHANVLWEFLAHPQIGLAQAAIRAICQTEPNEKRLSDQLRESVDLWAQTLVGSIHRHDPPFREDLALGVVRWLHRLSKWASEISESEPLPNENAEEHARLRAGARSVARAADDAVFDVRRWTLFAPQAWSRRDIALHASPSRPYRPGLAYQLARLEVVVNLNDATRRELEEVVVKECVLFNRRIDDEVQEPRNSGDGIPYDVARLQIGDEELCAVVFRQRAIRLYRIDVAPEIKNAHDESMSAPRRVRTRRTIDLPKGATRFGRAAVLWSNGDTQLLLTTIHDGKQESLSLWDVTDLPRPLQWQSEAVAGLENDAAMCLRLVSVTSPELSDDSSNTRTALILMGLRQGSGDAVVEALRVEAPEKAGNAPALKREVFQLHDARNTMIPNPVHCVHFARRRKSPSDSKYRVVAGCDDGTVWVLDDTDLGEGPKPTAEIVARLAAPIWKVQCRELSDGRLRVYAGTSDGHIFAWDEFEERRTQAGRQATENPERTPEPRFACLWSTKEARGIVSLSLHRTMLDGHPTESVLAVSRNGRAVLFADHERVEPRGSEPDAVQAAGSDRVHRERHGRSRAPGQRLERFDLQTTAFAAGVLSPFGSVVSAGLSPVARLLVATGDSVVRVVSLHQPKRSEIRKERYRKLGVAWFRSLSPTPGGSTLDVHRLRYTEALRALAPSIWLLPIRLFTPSLSARELSAYEKSLRALPVDWFPRHLRHYLRSTHALREVMGALMGTSWSGAFQHDVHRLCETLKLALGDARRLHDKKLFQEMMSGVERSINEVLLRVCTSKDAVHAQRDELMLQLYNKVHDELEQACRPWLTIDVDAYAHVQSVRIKNMVDGLCVFHVAMEQPERDPLRTLLRTRVQHFQRLLREANPLIPLETLTAINLSLLSAAWLQYDDDRAWPRHRTFVDVIGTFASQASTHAGDAVAHEIARVHALCLIIAPHEATRVAMSMRAGELPEQLLQETKLQLRLLPRLLPGGAGANALAACREKARVLFAECLDKPPHAAPPPISHEFAANSGPSAPVEVAFLAEHKGWFKAYSTCGAAVEALATATKSLQHAPQWVSFREVHNLKKTLDRAEPDKKQLAELREKPNSKLSDQERALLEQTYFAEQFVHDRAYFKEQLARFETICKTHAIPTTFERSRGSDGARRTHLNDDDRPVAPAVILASLELESWAKRARAALKETEVPEPRRTHYRNALAAFEHVTSELRESSAVQRRLVTGVLGHHLLEALDDHLLTLAETAHVLYPRKLLAIPAAEAHRSSLGQHATALSEQVEHARAIPKNLRALYRLLRPFSEAPTDGRPSRLTEVRVREIFEQAFEAEQTPSGKLHRVKERKCSVTPRVAASLGLVFAELASNYRVHGKFEGVADLNETSNGTGKWQLTVSVGLPEDAPTKRLVDVVRREFQDFSPPNADVEESSGVGLYLANLAASVVGWKISLHGQDEAIRCFAETEKSIEERYEAAGKSLKVGRSLKFILTEQSP